MMQSALRRFYSAYLAWWQKYGPLAMALMALTLVVCGFLTWQATVTNGRQDRERDRVRDQLLRCFDDRDTYAAESSQELRDATQTWNDAVEAKAQSVERFAKATGEWSGILVDALANQTPSTPAAIAEFVKATAAIQSTSRLVEARAEQLVEASRKLRQARVDNPVVPPASVLCKTGVFVPPE